MSLLQITKLNNNKQSKKKTQNKIQQKYNRCKTSFHNEKSNKNTNFSRYPIPYTRY